MCNNINIFFIQTYLNQDHFLHCYLSHYCVQKQGALLTGALLWWSTKLSLHLSSLQSLLAVEQEALSCKEARHKVYHKAGIYSKAAMEEPLILLYKKNITRCKAH